MKQNINNYTGNKGSKQLKAFILNNVPKCSAFFECYAGSAAISFDLFDQNIKGLDLIVATEKNPEVRSQLIKKRSDLKKGTTGEEYRTTEFIIGRECEECDLYMHFADKSVFFYLDPPYLLETRRSFKKVYGDYEWTDEMHNIFLNRIKDIQSSRALIMVSHYPCSLYNNALKGWYTKEIKVMTRGGLATEKIWMNYNINEHDLLTSKYYATNAQDRQRLQRQRRLLNDKLERMPRHQRQYILDGLIKKLEL